MATEREVDPNEEIGGTTDMGGFVLPPEGNVKEGTGTLMEFTGEISECGPDKKSLGFELGWAEDLSQKAHIYIKWTSPQGLARLVGIGQQSGLFDKIDKKRAEKGKKPIQSEKGTVKSKILMDPVFHEQMRSEIEGLQVLCSITHKPAEPYTDKETGMEKEGFPKADIGMLVNPKNAPKATQKTENAKAATSAPDAGESDADDDWED